VSITLDLIKILHRGQQGRAPVDFCNRKTKIKTGTFLFIIRFLYTNESCRYGCYISLAFGVTLVKYLELKI